MTFKVETAFADVRLEKGLSPLKNVGIHGPNNFVALFKDTPENRATAHDLVNSYASSQAEIKRLKEALTPSADTKAAYIGEFSFGVTLTAGDEEDYRIIQVPWTTIKEIMAAISERAERSKP